MKRPWLTALLNKVRPLSAGLFVIAILSFLLPWVFAEWYHLEGPPHYRAFNFTYVVNGTDLLLGRDVTDSLGDLREVDPEPLAVAVLVLAAVGAALSLSKGKWSYAVRGLAGWLGVILLVWIFSNLSHATDVDVELGLWLAVSALAIVAFLNALAFGRLHPAESVTEPLLAALLNIVPLAPGVGYLYVGRPARFASAFVGFFLVSVAALGAIVAIAFSTCWSAGCSKWERSYPIVMPILYLAFIAWDAQRIARKHNEAVAERTEG